MVSIIVATLLALGLVGWRAAVPSAEAAAPAAPSARLTMEPPRPVSATAVALRGKVRAPRSTVVLQRRGAGGWQALRRVRVVGRSYGTVVRRLRTPQRVRVVAGRLRSPVRVVPATPTGPGPTTTPTPPSTPPTTPPDPGAPDACGPRQVKPDGTPWVCTFADDFTGPTLDLDKWIVQTAFVTGEPDGRYACYHDDPGTVAVGGGSLHLQVRRLAVPVGCGYGDVQPTALVGGMVSTAYRFSQRYGRFEARFRSTAAVVPGLQEAFWLWPDSRDESPLTWPAAGEIDIVETYSAAPDLAIPYLHYGWNDNGGPVEGLNTAHDCLVDRGVFNTFRLDWSAQRIEIFVNGKRCLVNTSGDVAFQRRYIIALTQGLGLGENGLRADTPLPAVMEVDYVRVWR